MFCNFLYGFNHRSGRAKLAEYESIGILEYWIVEYAALGGTRYIGHPKQPTLSIYNMESGQGEFGKARQFRGEDCIESVIVPGFTLTASNLWRAG
jgi:Uma2 family endonuclease